MKQTIEWYRDGQKNHQRYIDEMKLKRSQLTEEIKQSEKGFNFKEKQILEAIKQGKDRFDSERFLVKRKVRKVEDSE